MELKEIEQAIKNVYLPVFQANVKDDKLLSKITYTTNDIYGKELIKFYNEKTYKKELTNFYVYCIFTQKALRCTTSATVLVNLVNSEFEDAIADAKSLIVKHILKTIKEECALSVEDKVLYNYLVNLDYEDLKQIELHELCDWEFLENGQSSIIHQTSLADNKIILVKYAEVFIYPELKEKIIKDLGEKE